MDCHHGEHHHHHHHHHGLAETMPLSHLGRLKVVFAISLLYLICQSYGGYISGSLGLMAEATHKLGDLTIVGLALIAAWVAKKAASPQKTFGFDRIEIIAAFVSGLSLILASVLIITEATSRTQSVHHHHIEGNVMMLVAVIGVILNGLEIYILNPFKEKNLNIRGAYYHIMADLLGSSGNVISAALIIRFHLSWLDTAISFIIAIFVLVNGIHIAKDSVKILLNMTPAHINPDKVAETLMEQDVVEGVHDLHIWTITTGKEAIMAHVVVNHEAYSSDTVQALEDVLRDTWQFCHITLQLEPPDFDESPMPF